MTDQQPNGPRQPAQPPQYPQQPPAPQPPQPGYPQQPVQQPGYPQQPVQHPGYPQQQPGYPQQQFAHPPQNQAAPAQPGDPGKRKGKMSKGAVIGLVIALVIGIPIIGLGVLIGVRLITDITATNDERLSLTAEKLIPRETDVFLDDRYADGFRTVEFDGVLGSVLGITSDRSQAIVFVHSGHGNRENTNEWLAVDIASGDVVRRQEVQQCSNITPEDTIFCTRSVTGDSGAVRAFAEVDIATGNALTNRQLPDIGTASIEFVGRAPSGEAIVVIESQDGLGTPLYRHMYSLPAENTDAAWVTDLSPNREWVEGCGLFGDPVVIACTSADLGDIGIEDAPEELFEDVPLDEATVVTFDPATGEQITSFDTPGSPVFAADGVAVEISPMGGVSMGGTGDETKTIAYDYAGNVIFESPDYVGVTLYPEAKPASATYPQVTYTLETLHHGSGLNHYVINAAGEVVLKSEYQMTDSIGAEENFSRQTDGQVLFTGVPIGVSADGSAVLYEEDSLGDSAHLINVATGEEIAEIVPTSLSPSVDVERGIISYDTDDDKVVFLIPGN